MTKPDDKKRLADYLSAPPTIFNTHMGENSRPPEDDSNDPAVIWGKRVGRGLAVIGAIVLVAYLVETYL
jgi:hypothetical protein